MEDIKISNHPDETNMDHFAIAYIPVIRPGWIDVPDRYLQPFKRRYHSRHDCGTKFVYNDFYPDMLQRYYRAWESTDLAMDWYAR